MTYPSVSRIAASAIPVIDIGPLRGGEAAGIRTVAQALRRASAEVGFFYVRNHGVPETAIAAADQAARRFFALPLEQKLEVRINRHHHGFLRMGEARMADGIRPDLKESFVWGLELPEEDPERQSNPFLGPNPWPAFLPELRAGLYPFYEAMTEVATSLMRAFAIALDLPPDRLIGPCRRPISRASAICYPPQPPGEGNLYGVGPHTDYGCMTLVHQDEVGGLEVQDVHGEWLTAHPIPGTLVANVGDLLSRWSNDKLVSTPHRVVNRGGVARHSMALAFDPDFDTVVDPAVFCAPGESPKYLPTTCGQYVLGRFDRAFAYRKAAAAGDADRRP
ncbi:MAG: 2-oxoglutarate and iron-dependent oxygenase domain-containing protein [Dongiaceae bacterium]